MSDVRYWWVQLGYHSFDPGTGDDVGFPNPGRIIRYYRERKLWKHPDGSEKKCRQIDLASALGVSESWVREMENSNEGLNSITRRKVLKDLLDIPPVLLGLVALEDLTKLDTGAKTRQLHPTTIEWYIDSLGDSWQLYYTGTTSDLSDKVTRKIGHIGSVLDAISTPQQKTLLGLECRFYMLASRVASDQSDYNKALSFLKSGMKVAKDIGSNDLIANILFWRGRTYLEKSDFPSARMALDKALSYSKQAKSPLRGAILLEAGLSHSYLATTDAEKKYAVSLFDQALPLIRSNKIEDDGSFVKLNPGRYHHFRAEALIAMKQPKDALKELELAEQNTGVDLTRRRAYINILRAKASLDLGDFSYATYLALDALSACKAIKSSTNVDFIQEIAVDLDKSPYSNSSEVAQLKRELRTL